MGVPQVILRKIDGEEILRRVDAHGVTLMCGAPAVVAAILDAAAARRAAGRDRPGRRRDPHRGRRRPAAVQDHRAGRDRARLGVHPDLRADRDRPAADHQPGAGRVGRPGRAPSGPGSSRAPGVPAVGVQIRTDETARCWPAPTTCSPATGSSPRRRPSALEDGWFHTGDGGHIEDGDYLVISDRKKDVIISGGENVSSIEVEDCLYQHPAVAEVAVIGVPDEKWGETVKALVVLRDGAERHRAGPDRALPGPAGPLQVPDVGRVPRRAGPHRHRQAAEVQAARAVLGRLREAGQLSVTHLCRYAIERGRSFTQVKLCLTRGEPSTAYSASQISVVAWARMARAARR